MGAVSQVEHQFAGHLQRLQTEFTCHQQKFDEGPVSLGRLEDAIAHKLNGGWQIPFAERHAIAQRARLSLQNWQIVPGIAEKRWSSRFGEQACSMFETSCARRLQDD